MLALQAKVGIKKLQGAQEFVKQIWEFMEHHPTNVCNYFIQKNVGISAK